MRPQEAKESIDEEDPRPTSSTWSYTIRLGLASDRMSPFGNLSTNHSSWPVLLMIYNFLPWLCMKPKYIMLCMMIAGPRQPGNEIEIYLTPLVEDLRKLWVNRVDVFDGNLQQTFRLWAMVFCTINDFPTYGNLSGYSVKGHLTCPIIEKGTSFIQLKHGKKTIYTRHRRFLKPYHLYQWLKKAFNGSQENESAPKPLAGNEVYDRVKGICWTSGLNNLRGGELSFKIFPLTNFNPFLNNIW